jgi:hypothetical protein
MTDPAMDLSDRFLAPSPEDPEVVILTDKAGSSAIMATHRNTTALTAEAVSILQRSFLADEPLTVPDLLGSTESELAQLSRSWVIESVETNIVQLSSARLERSVDEVQSLNAGDIIAVRTFPGREGIPVEHPGQLSTVHVGDTTIFWFSADINLPERGGVFGVGHAAGATVAGGVSLQMRAQRVPGSVGANCNVCTACGGCGACGACGLCGGVDFAAAALALVAVDAALTLTNAASTFELLRQ